VFCAPQQNNVGHVDGFLSLGVVVKMDIPAVCNLMGLDVDRLN